MRNHIRREIDRVKELLLDPHIELERHRIDAYQEEFGRSRAAYYRRARVAWQEIWRSWGTDPTKSDEPDERTS